MLNIVLLDRISDTVSVVQQRNGIARCYLVVRMTVYNYGCDLALCELSTWPFGPSYCTTICLCCHTDYAAM